MTEKLPKGWKRCLISEIAEIVSGGTPSSKDLSNFADSTGIPWITPADLSGYKDKFIAAGKRFLSEKGLKCSSARVLPAGTVLFTSRAPVGYVAIAANPVATNQGFKSFVIKSEVLSEYLYYYLKSQKEAIESLASGTTFLELSGGNAKKITVVLPPIDEQKQIVARLDQLLARVDSCRAHLDRAAAAIKRFRQSVLNAAVTGQLTYELNLTTNKDLEQIADYLSKQSNLKKNETDKLTVSLDYDLPPHWCTAPLGLLISACSYGSSQKSAKTGLIPVLRMGNIQSGILDWEDLVYTSDQTEIDKYLLEPGDVLFNRTNSPELVGKTAMYKEGTPKAIYAGYLIRVKTLPALNPQFLTYCLNSSYGRHFSWQVKTDGVSQSNINASKLCAFPTPICSRTEQDEIVRRAEALFQKAYEMESKLTAARERVDNLTASILAKAFRGELFVIR